MDWRWGKWFVILLVGLICRGGCGLCGCGYWGSNHGPAVLLPALAGPTWVLRDLAAYSYSTLAGAALLFLRCCLYRRTFEQHNVQAVNLFGWLSSLVFWGVRYLLPVRRFLY